MLKLPGLFLQSQGKIYLIPGYSRNILEFFWQPEVTGHYKKNSTSMSQEKFTGNCREFKGK